MGIVIFIKGRASGLGSLRNPGEPDSCSPVLGTLSGRHCAYLDVIKRRASLREGDSEASGTSDPGRTNMSGKQSWTEGRKGILAASGFFRLRRQDTETGEPTRTSPKTDVSTLVSTLVTTGILRGRHALPHYRQQRTGESSLAACRHRRHKSRTTATETSRGRGKCRKEGK